MNNIKEYLNCFHNPIYFINNYCLVNNKHVYLKNYQISFINYIYERNFKFKN